MSAAAAPGHKKYYSRFNPLDIPSCQLWLDATDTTSLTLSGSNITAWNDKSGNGRNMTASGTITNTGSINGLTAANWASDSYFYGTASNTGNTVTVFTVFNMTSSTAGSNARVISLGISGNNDYDTVGSVIPILRRSGTIVGAYRNSTELSRNTNATDQAVVMCSLFNGSTNTIYTNGTASSAVASTGNFAYTQHRVGSNTNATDTSGFFRGTIGEVIIYNDALTDSQRQQVEGYLSRKWSSGSLTNTFVPFTPTTISGCSLWLDANDTSTLTLSGTSVIGWKNKISSSDNFSYYFGNVVYSSNFRSGNGVISLTSNGTLANTTYVWPTSNYTVFVIGYLSATNAGNYSRLLNGGGVAGDSSLFLGSGGSASGNYATFTGSGPSGGWNDVTTNSPATSVYQVWSLMGMKVASTVLTPYINGTAQNTKTGTTAPFTGLSIGGIYTNSGTQTTSQTWSGYVAEIIVYDSALSDSDRQQVEGYLAKKWGIQSSLPATHPYRIISLPTTHPYYSINPVTRQFAAVDVTGCCLWVDAMDSSSFTFSGSNIVRWNDKSGNEYHLNQTTTSSAPTQSGNYVVFSSDRFLNIPQAALNNLSTYSIFLVINPISANNWIFVKQHNGVNTHNVLSMTYNTSTGGGAQTGASQFMYWRPYNAGTQINSGQIFYTSSTAILEIVFDGTNMIMYRNGIQLSSSSASGTGAIQNQTSASNFTLGAWISSGVFVNSGQTNFQLGEMMFFTSNLSTSQRQQIEGYLLQKWGIITTTPSITVFNPTSISGCSLWLDAADSSTLTLSGSNVTQWNDKSGNGRNTSSVTGTPQLSYSGGFRSLPSIYFGASSAFTGSISYTGTTLTAFVVARVNTVANPLRFFSLGQSGRNDYASTSDIVVLTTGNATTELGWYRNYVSVGNGSANVTTIYNSPFLYTLNVNGSTGVIVVNGNTAGPSTTSSGTTSGSFGYSTYAIGGGFTPTLGNYLGNGFIAEIILYNASLTATQRQQVEGYLASKWGTQTNLPFEHPYSLRVSSTFPYLTRNPATAAFIPRQIANCALWLDSADSSTLTLSGSNVTTWNDKSGNGRNFTASGTGATWSSTAPGLVFTTNLYTSSYTAAVTSETIFAVVKYSSTGFFIGSSANGGREVGVYSSTQFGIPKTGIEWGPITPVSSVSAGTTYLVTGITSGTSVQIGVNGTTRFSTATLASGFSGGNTQLGREGASSFQFQGTLYEVIAYSSVLSTADRQRVEAYLAWKWGVNIGYTTYFSSNFLPTSLGNCVVWYDGLQSSNFTLSGSNISQWNDRSGNNFHATQATTAKQATYLWATGGVQMTTSSWYNINSTTGATYTRTHSVFIVATRSTAQGYFYGRNPASGGGPAIIAAFSGTSIEYYDSSQRYTFISTPVASRPFIACYTRTQGGNIVGRFNGSTIFTQAQTFDNGITQRWLYLNASQGDTFTDKTNSIVYEFIIYSAALTTAQVQQVEGYLAWKWNITDLLADGHPYKPVGLVPSHPYKLIEP